MTTAPAPVTTRAASAERAVTTLVTAFAADPVIRWIYPAPAAYLAHFPEMVTLLAAPAFATGNAFQDDDATAAALWVPPGFDPDGAAAADLLQRTVAPERWDEAFAFLAQVEEHHPAAPHWYLPFVGVDPMHQGRGRGSALLARGLARCDAGRLPAYLEASTRDNRRLYERHGFVALGEIRAGDSPPLWPMLRPAR